MCDLKPRIERAMDYMIRWVETSMAKRVEDPHNFGRAVDGLIKGEAVTGKSAPPAVLDALRDRLLACTDNELGFPYAHDRCSAHDLRECVQAFLEITVKSEDDEALGRLGKLLDSLLYLTDEQGEYRTERVGAYPMLRNSEFVDDGDPYISPPQNRGRMIMALCQVYREMGDARASATGTYLILFSRHRASSTLPRVAYSAYGLFFGAPSLRSLGA